MQAWRSNSKYKPAPETRGGVADNVKHTSFNYFIHLTTNNILQAKFTNKKVNTMAIQFIRQSRGDTLTHRYRCKLSIERKLGS